jgi:ATP-dependent DNA helicase DinG
MASDSEVLPTISVPDAAAQGPSVDSATKPNSDDSVSAATGEPTAERMPELAAFVAEEFFGPDGPLAALLDGYEMRPSQVEMARAMQAALLGGRHAVIEAPTGTGKSLAYLIPAILSGRKVVVATANKSLQNQLFSKDMPLVCQALGREIDTVVVKGRSNYLCTWKWEKELDQQRQFALYDREHDQIQQLKQWLNLTETGDVDELPFVIEGDLRPRVVSFPDDCLQRECPHFDDACWVNLMRDRASDAQVIITNHHLLLNALELGYAGERILPPAHIYIVDEAHGLEQTATSVYETVVTDYTVEQALARGILKEYVADEELELLRLANALAFQEVTRISRDNSFVIETELEEMKRLSRQLDALADKLVRDYLPKGTIESDSGATAGAGTDADRAAAEKRRSLELAVEVLRSSANSLLEVARAGREGEIVRYATRVFDRRHVSIEVHSAPINPAGLLAQYLFDGRTDDESAERMVVCTSATLATEGGFEHFKARCGIHSPCEERVLPAVFDYQRQALLYQPALPSYDYRNADAFYQSVSTEIERLLQVSRGRALCLFTSWSGLQQVRERLAANGLASVWPIRAQGDSPRDALLRWLRETPHAVLLATRSFWEGVDIPGDDLTLVVLDKMPFPTPGDPLHAARMNRIEQEGGSSFSGYMTPLMTLALKQGFGRLIRRGTDNGVVAILDDRLSSKAYGRQARKDLPAARFSRDFKDVHQFFQQVNSTVAEFAVNVAARSGDEPLTMAWSWQLVRLQDGKSNSEQGLLPSCGEPSLAEVYAASLALADLLARIQRAGREPGQYAVEIRSTPDAAALLRVASSSGLTPELTGWKALNFIELDSDA